MKRKIPHLRWLVALALLFAAVLNYIDRSVLGLLANTIQKDLGISNDQYAGVVNWFLIAYTVAYLLSGRVVDKLGVRLSLALFVGWWSISNALTGLAQSVRSLAVFRFMLGLGEAGGFTASPKAVGEWFPPSERGIAVGIYSLGGALGAAVAPILVANIAGHPDLGWRWVFAVSPVLAGIWLVFWLWLYRAPAAHPRITAAELSHLKETIDSTAAAADAPRESEWALWRGVFREPMVWRLMVARMITDPVWYFYQFWMPKYLQEARGLDQKGVAIMWMVFVAADFGFILGGIFSGRLIKRGGRAPAARLWVMLTSACLVPFSFLIPAMPTVALVITVAMLVCYAHTQWLTNMTSLVVDIMPKRILATSFGVIAAGSALGGIFMNKIVAAYINPAPIGTPALLAGVDWVTAAMSWLNAHRGYESLFVIMACVHPLALLVIWGLRKKGAAA
jgi:ACS family hexuronate transporter-like MFS transporter